MSRLRGFGEVFMQLAEERPVAYYPKLVKVAGSVNAAIFLSQLGYWTPKAADPDGWVYKTQSEWESETGLSRWEQETARRQLRERAILTEVKRGMPARLYFRIDVDALSGAWDVTYPVQDVDKPQPRMRDSHKQSLVGPGSGSPSMRRNHNQQAGPSSPQDVGSPQPNKGTGTTAGTTSTTPGGGGEDLDLEDLRVKLAHEFELRSYDLDLLDSTLDELRLTAATTLVRHPLRYCLRAAQNLQASRDATVRSDENQELHLEWRHTEEATCPHGSDWAGCGACKDDIERGRRIRAGRARGDGEAVA